MRCGPGCSSGGEPPLPFLSPVGMRCLPYCSGCDKPSPGKSLGAVLAECRKTYITKRVVRPTPINPQKAATCAWLFALCKGGAPRWSGVRTAILSLVRCPDGHTFFGPVSGRPYFLWSGVRTAILSLVRCPDGHTLFGPVSGRPYSLCLGGHNRPSFCCPARERSMGAEALRQPLAKTRKSGLSHFFDTLKGSPSGSLFCLAWLCNRVREHRLPAAPRRRCRKNFHG